MVIAVDFDSTLMNPDHKLKGYRMGQPMPGAVFYTNKLAQMGHEIIIFTARNVNQPSAHKAVEDWLKFFQIPHHGITNIKQPYFDVYIDDRALHFDRWEGMLTKIDKFGKKET